MKEVQGSPVRVIARNEGDVHTDEAAIAAAIR